MLLKHKNSKTEKIQTLYCGPLGLLFFSENAAATAIKNSIVDELLNLSVHEYNALS